MYCSIRDQIICLSLDSGGRPSVDILPDGYEIGYTEGCLTVKKDGRPVIEKLEVQFPQGGGAVVMLRAAYSHVFGLGERFDRVDQRGLTRKAEIIEKFCYQGELSYCPIPFFLTDSGFGLFVDSLASAEFCFEDDLRITLSPSTDGQLPRLYLFLGTPKEILSSFSSLTGKPKLPPKWAFGVWISANRWNNQREVEHQLELCRMHEFPVTVTVIEAWSDEATFYIWNEAKYKENGGRDGFAAGDFQYGEQGLWTNPEKLLRTLEEEGVKLVLWQIPVLKKLDDGQSCEQHDRDCRYAVENDLCVKNPDGTPYVIPEGHWFAGSMLPDFTNPETVSWWFSKRKYLLDMGVAGFKTDGGEFIYREDARFHDGSTGREMVNGFAQRYIKAYSEAVGPNRVLFSRAGFTGQQGQSILWAGDQQSTWEEFRHILAAGLSAGLSGIPVWGFDIAGFAGPLPGLDLYERATQMAVFSPVMQWHSEPAGGQFAELMKGSDGINDRSPWNMAKLHGDPQLMDRVRFHYNLRMNLLPHVYCEAVKSAESGLPMLRHLAVDYSGDVAAWETADEFLLGDLLVAPILQEDREGREVYLPEGAWTDLWSGQVVEGGKSVFCKSGRDRIPVFLRHGGAAALNLGPGRKLGTPVGNRMDGYKDCCILIAGDEGNYRFADDLGNEVIVTWKAGQVEMEKTKGKLDLAVIREA